MLEQLYYPTESSMDSLKVPPNSIAAEQSVLGGLMLDNAAWDKIVDVVRASDFYYRNHQLIFSAIAKLIEKRLPVDIVTVADILDRQPETKNLGGMGSNLAYLGMIVRDTPTAANIEAYAQNVREKSILRQLIQIGTQINESVFKPDGKTTQELLESAEQAVFSIAEQIQREGGFRHIKPLLAEAVDKIEARFEQDGHITGLATGFADFDEKTSGLQAADLIIIAGRPSMGKTAIAMNIAEHIAIQGKKQVAVFSMEMPADALAMRMMSSLGRINQLKVRTGKLEEHEWPRMTSAINILAETGLFIDDTPALTLTELTARARRLARDHGKLGLIVIDYLQLMHSPSSGPNRVQQISDISRGLKALAKELNVPVIALSQLNRSLEQRPNKRPIMSDLRESGAIEQDADLIAFVYRDEVYNEDSPEKGIAELIIGKQRNGPLGTVRLTFLGEFTRFENFASAFHGNEEDYE